MIRLTRPPIRPIRPLIRPQIRSPIRPIRPPIIPIRPPCTYLPAYVTVVIFFLYKPIFSLVLLTHTTKKNFFHQKISLILNP